MEVYNVQLTTDTGETFVVQVMADSEAMAEMTAIMQAEEGDADHLPCTVVDCFCV